MQALSKGIDHAFVRLDFTGATDNQKEVLSYVSEFVREHNVI